MLAMFHKQKGFGIITSLFLITGMIIIGLSFVLFMTEQKTNTALEILQTKSFFAAKSGINIANYNSLVLNSCATTASPISLGNDLYVSYTCTRTTKKESGQAIITDQIISTGCYNPLNNSCPSATKTGLYTEKQIIAYLNP